MLHSSLFAVLLIALPGAVMFSSPAARICAAPLPSSKTLRVMTYNIHVGVGMDKKLDLPRIAGVINAQHPDLVGLQEVDRGVTRTQQIDEICGTGKAHQHGLCVCVQSEISGRSIRSRNSLPDSDQDNRPSSL